MLSACNKKTCLSLVSVTVDVSFSGGANHFNPGWCCLLCVLVSHANQWHFCCYQAQSVGVKTITMLDEQGGNVYR